MTDILSTPLGIQHLGSKRLARDIRIYIQCHNLDRLKPVLEKHGIADLDALLASDARDRLLSDKNTTLSETEAILLSESAIRTFRDHIASQTWNMLSARLAANHHFIFLSHYKVESGTEAALMRSEMERIINEDSGHAAKDLDAAIFLDSEDLTDLINIMRAVQKSHNLFLLLTKNIFTRPWCIVEIGVAVRDRVNIVPVKITKPGSEFQFPDEAFYADLIDGKVLGEEGTALVENSGFDMHFIAQAIRRVLQRIALPYSPHRTGLIRKAELEAIMQNCNCREIVEDMTTARASCMESLFTSVAARYSRVTSPGDGPGLGGLRGGGLEVGAF